jgi:uncharacterized protein (TIGR00730 family)
MFKKLKRTLKITCSFLRATFQAAHGAYRLSSLPDPIVTVFGGTKFEEGSVYFKQAHELANKLVDNNISVISGGGVGIMHAVNCGAAHDMPLGDGHTDGCKQCERRCGACRTMGIGISGIPQERLNPCVGKPIIVDYFFVRKFLMMNFSCGFVVFPGGLGTMDELSEIFNLIYVKKLPEVPIILFDVEYWKNYLTWLKFVHKERVVSHKGVSLITVTDDVDNAVSILKKHCLENK